MSHECGTIHTYGPRDPFGCRLPSDHSGPHEFLGADGVVYQWETDLSCECEDCMQCDGDYCTIYWEASAASTQAEKEGE